MPEPWTLSEGRLRRHVKGIETALASVVDSRVLLGIEPGVGPSVTVMLRGGDSEWVSRNRGPNVYVAPLCNLREDLWAWLGYREEWANEASGKTPGFSFRSIGLTVHFGYRNEGRKPQMFRAEWSGCSKWDGSEYGFQGGDAGHPHWQFDALESLSAGLELVQAEDERKRLRGDDAAAGPREFGEKDNSPASVEKAIGSRKLSRIHFPSAAAWWKEEPANLHAHSPACEREIEVWTEKTLRYVLRELRRL